MPLALTVTSADSRCSPDDRPPSACSASAPEQEDLYRGAAQPRRHACPTLRRAAPVCPERRAPQAVADPRRRRPAGATRRPRASAAAAERGDRPAARRGGAPARGHAPRSSTAVRGAAARAGRGLTCVAARDAGRAGRGRAGRRRRRRCSCSRSMSASTGATCCGCGRTSGSCRRAELDAWVPGLVAAGRRSRAIYPPRVLEEAPQVIRDRADVRRARPDPGRRAVPAGGHRRRAAR